MPCQIGNNERMGREIGEDEKNDFHVQSVDDAGLNRRGWEKA
jgi:hypothetical protein